MSATRSLEFHIIFFKKLYWFVFMSLMIVSCNKENVSEVRYYPDKSIFQNGHLLKIDLDSTEKDFKEITDIVIDAYANDSVPYMQFKTKKSIKKILVQRSAGGLIVERNMLRIGQDSIFSRDNLPIKDLDSVLKVYYYNYGKVYYYSDRPEKAGIEISIDTSSKSELLKEVLNNLTTKFDALNLEKKDSLKLKIIFDYFHQIPLPPDPK